MVLHRGRSESGGMASSGKIGTVRSRPAGIRRTHSPRLAARCPAVTLQSPSVRFASPWLLPPGAGATSESTESVTRLRGTCGHVAHIGGPSAVVSRPYDCTDGAFPYRRTGEEVAEFRPRKTIEGCVVGAIKPASLEVGALSGPWRSHARHPRFKFASSRLRAPLARFALSAYQGSQTIHGLPRDGRNHRGAVSGRWCCLEPFDPLVIVRHRSPIRLPSAFGGRWWIVCGPGSTSICDDQRCSLSSPRNAIEPKVAAR
jgi:hypothetical protein